MISKLILDSNAWKTYERTRKAMKCYYLELLVIGETNMADVAT